MFTFSSTLGRLEMMDQNQASNNSEPKCTCCPFEDDQRCTCDLMLETPEDLLLNIPDDLCTCPEYCTCERERCTCELGSYEPAPVPQTSSTPDPPPNDFHERCTCELGSYEPAPVPQTSSTPDPPPNDFQNNPPTDGFTNKPTKEEGFTNKPTNDGFANKPTKEEGFTNKPTNQGFTDKPTNQGFTDKPSNQGFTDKPTNQGFTDKPTNQCFTDKPTNQGFTDKPYNQGFTSKPNKEEGFTNKPTKEGGLDPSLLKKMIETLNNTNKLLEENAQLVHNLTSDGKHHRLSSAGVSPAGRRACSSISISRQPSVVYSNRNLVSGQSSFFRDEDAVRREYAHQMTIELKASYLKITDVDTISQQFEAEIFIQAKWEEWAYAGYPQTKLDTLGAADLWEPYLILVNSVGEFDQERRSYVVRYEDDYEAPVVLHRWRFKGLFREPLELQYFPFDVQDLSLLVSTERSIDEVKMKHDPYHLSSVNTLSFQDFGEWAIYKHVECTHHTTNMEYASAAIHPILMFQCRVRRKIWYFLWNIIFIVFLVMVLSFLTIAVESTTSDRLANTMTLFLTMVAFKLVVKQSLPTISYLTYLDVYVIFSLIYLVLFAFENAAIMTIARWMDPKLVEDYDSFCCMLLVTILIFFHFVFIIHIHVSALSRHRQMQEFDRHYAIQARNLLINAEKHKKKKKKKDRLVPRQPMMNQPVNQPIPSYSEERKKPPTFPDDPQTTLLLKTL